MDDENSEQSGQRDVGCVAITVMSRPFSVIWTSSINIPSGSGRNGVLSIIPSLLKQNCTPEVSHGREYSMVSHFTAKRSKRADSPNRAMSHFMALDHFGGLQPACHDSTDRGLEKFE